MNNAYGQNPGRMNQLIARLFQKALAFMVKKHKLSHIQTISDFNFEPKSAHEMIALNNIVNYYRHELS